MWIDINKQEPELKDACVLMHFENGVIETVHIEDFFKPVTNGINDKGEQQYTKLRQNTDKSNLSKVSCTLSRRF